MADKAAIRSTLKAARAAVAPAHRRAAALAIADFGVRFLKPYHPAVIAGYIPIGSEADPRPLMQDLERRGHTLALPVVNEKAAPLQFRQWSITDPLEEGAYGIPIPQSDSPIVEPAIVLVPGLGFDSAMNRMGYGGGYYDRTLKNLIAKNPRFAALGIAFSSQMVDKLPIDITDVPMAGVITDVGISLPAG